MYAMIESGGKQYKAEVGTIVKVEKLNAAVDDEVTFDVLLTSKDGEIQVGDPYLKDVAVKGVVIEQGKAKKIIVFKYKAKKDYRKKYGHRQPYTRVKITQIGDEHISDGGSQAKPDPDALTQDK